MPLCLSLSFSLSPIFFLNRYPQQRKTTCFIQSWMDRFIAASHFLHSELKWYSILQKEMKSYYILAFSFLLMNILVLGLRYFLDLRVCWVFLSKEMLQINLDFILIKWHMSTNVISGGPARFLSYINDPTLPLVYQRAEEWLLTLDSMHRIPEKKIWKSDWRIWKPESDNKTEWDLASLHLRVHLRVHLISC